MSKNFRNNKKDGFDTRDGERRRPDRRNGNGHDGGKGSSGKSAYSLPDCTRVVTDSHNDISWYNRNPQLLKDSCSINFNAILGLPYGSVEGRSDVRNTIPGIMKLEMFPTYGISKSLDSAVNQAARLLYSFVRHKNSGSRNYEAPDLMMYYLAVDSVITYHAELVRLYGLFRIYNARNRYIAKHVVEAMGYDYDSLSKNLADFRAYINRMAIKLNSLAIPKDLAIYDRHSFLSMHIWKDSPDDKSQLYIPQFKYYYKWSGTEFETGSALIPVAYTAVSGTTGATLADIANFGDALIDALMTNEDIGLMSGDTLKAWDTAGCRQVLGIAEDYATVPLYDEMVLSQIHNATITGEPLVSDALSASSAAEACITQNEFGSVMQNPLFRAPADFNFVPTIVLDSGFDNPTPEYVMEATRLTCGVNPTTVSVETQPYFRLESCGTEVVTKCIIYTNGTDSPNTVSYVTNRDDHPDLLSIVRSMAFDWAPVRYYCDGQYGSDAFLPMGEIFNYTNIAKSDISKMHEVALISLMQVPGTVTDVV